MCTFISFIIFLGEFGRYDPAHPPEILPGIFLENYEEMVIRDKPVSGGKLYAFLVSLAETQAPDLILPPVQAVFDVPLKNVRLPNYDEIEITFKHFAGLFGYSPVIDNNKVSFRPVVPQDPVVLYGNPVEITETLKRLLPGYSFESVPQDSEIYTYAKPPAAPLDGMFYIAHFGRGVEVNRNGSNLVVTYGSKRNQINEMFSKELFRGVAQDIVDGNDGIQTVSVDAEEKERKRLKGFGLIALLCLPLSYTARRHRKLLAISWILLLSFGYFQTKATRYAHAKAEIQRLAIDLHVYRISMLMGILIHDGEGVIAATESRGMIERALDKALLAKPASRLWPDYSGSFLDEFKAELFRQGETATENHPVYQTFRNRLKDQFLQYAQKQYEREWEAPLTLHAANANTL